ncbi:MAG TPA: SDR family NAD(P)-dependent oxidoreductase [Candidatus Acidoferrales bacterium]|nr:SDR family NAD(P)-dependent oxidoreductase [Candidatus Acidoferrales bacterium]
MATGRLEGRVAVVTGGARGIGRSVATEMARAGASVAIAARDEPSLAATCREILAMGAECLPVRCDVTDQESVAAMAEGVLARWGGVDIVVANAGIAGPTKLLHQMSLEEWRECVATDLDGVFLTFRAFIPALLERGKGTLLAMSSMTGKRPLVGRTPYASAKMGVIGLCRTLATELGPHGIRVNSVCPGAVAGPRIDAVIRQQANVQGISEQSARDQFTAPSALHRLVSAEEVARVCVYLASDDASGVTGEDVNVSAGVVMY